MWLAVKCGKEFGWVAEINSVAEDVPPSLFNVRCGSIN